MPRHQLPWPWPSATLSCPSDCLSNQRQSADRGLRKACRRRFSACAALHADPTVQSTKRVEYPNRVFELARFGINWPAPMPLSSDRQPDTVRFKVQHADLGSRKRTAVLDEDACLTRPRGPERIQPENCNMEPARSRTTGILQVKEKRHRPCRPEGSIEVCGFQHQHTIVIRVVDVAINLPTGRFNES